jgi:hypothetical protein
MEPICHTLNKATVIALRAEIQEALKSVAAKHGISITTGNGTFTGDNATLKLEIAVIAVDGTVVSKTVSAFQSLATLYGFKPEDLGRTFKSGSRTYTITGLDRNSYKYPLLASSNGKTYKLPLDAVRKALGIPVTNGRLGDFGVDVPGVSH